VSIYFLFTPGIDLKKLHLNDDWDYTPDEIIAREVFADPDLTVVMPQPPQPSKLCFRCNNLRLWSIDCSFYDSPTELAKKADQYSCALCRLLLQETRVRVESPNKSIHFSRASSYITIDNGKRQKSIANLYAMPGK
jgi:hypothetical protein